MPRLPDGFIALVTEAELPLAGEDAEALNELSAPALRLVVERAQELLGHGVGHLLVELGVAREVFEVAVSAGDAPADVFSGERTVGPVDDDRQRVRVCQRLMQAAARGVGMPRGMVLAQWGADGEYGDEMIGAVKALQRCHGFEPATGILGARELGAVRDAVRGAPAVELFPQRSETRASVTSASGAERMVAIGVAIAEATGRQRYTQTVDGRTYGYGAQDFAVQSRSAGMLRAPGGVGYRLDPDRAYWKCNVFGGVVISLAELPVATHAVGGLMHYPRAERFGERLARKPSWELVRYLDHRDAEEPQRAVTGAEQDEEIRGLLAGVVPGDLLFVDHPGAPGEDGGHTRVCVRAADPTSATPEPEFAQAVYEGVVVRRDGFEKFVGGSELRFWVVRHG